MNGIRFCLGLRVVLRNRLRRDRDSNSAIQALFWNGVIIYAIDSRLTDSIPHEGIAYLNVDTCDLVAFFSLVAKRIILSCGNACDLVFDFNLIFVNSPFNCVGGWISISSRIRNFIFPIRQRGREQGQREDERQPDGQQGSCFLHGRYLLLPI